jgi:hypothetical protein
VQLLWHDCAHTISVSVSVTTRNQQSGNDQGRAEHLGADDRERAVKLSCDRGEGLGDVDDGSTGDDESRRAPPGSRGQRAACCCCGAGGRAVVATVVAEAMAAAAAAFWRDVASEACKLCRNSSTASSLCAPKHEINLI